MSAEHLDGAVGGLPFDELLCRLLDMVACLLGSPRGSDVSNRILLERIRNCETLTRQLQGVQTMVIAEVVAATGSATCPGQGDADASGDEGRNGDNAASKGVAGAGRGAADEDEDEDTASVIGSRSRVAAEIAPLLCISRAWAGSLVVAAVRLEQNLPDILGLVCSGELDWYRAKLISDRLHHPLVGPAWFRPGCLNGGSSRRFWRRKRRRRPHRSSSGSSPICSCLSILTMRMLATAGPRLLER